eukprot:TRINITY_DN78791_c0_g1_i1.p1 TRINITY_DN78791_c0_g1~~TRINITY_DN78791_c0_g1_i1.p1  ORF type:complete len:1013 (+),score=161.86 TRINITY_DN78791_c0_g1_i1:127-3165(+)
MKFIVPLVFLAGAFGAKLKYGKEMLAASDDADATTSCPEGRTKTAGGCTDIDECAIGTHNCVTNPCRNTDGSYLCLCAEGYSGVLPTCENIDECKGANTCTNSAYGVTCVDTPGSYFCACRSGWEQLSNVGNDTVTACKEANECKTGTHNCHIGATCSNTFGSFSCKCNVGWTGNGVDCKDINECEGIGKRKCASSQLGWGCINAPGSYACGCLTGFSHQANGCVNINECAQGPINVTNAHGHTCKNTSKCLDTLGSFTCSCQEGYAFNSTSKQCEDFNECQVEGIANCTQRGQMCVNNVGSYTCACKPGWTGTSTCTDINECTTNSSSCHATLGTCANTHGSFSCSCNDGYIGDGVTCTDYRQCVFGMDNCDKNARCADAVGGTVCTCNDGWTGNGLNCSDVDECANTTLKQCHATLSTCTNSVGSYYCGCNAGYSGNGIECDNIDECASGLSNCTVTNAQCIDTNGSYTCGCNPGYQLTSDGKVCVDKDECYDNAVANQANTSIPLICGEHGKCWNSVGSYRCACRTGYAIKASTDNCSDIDECAAGTHNCDELAMCRNTAGSFECHCRAGYNGTGARFTGGWPPKDGCWDIDECATSNLTCASNATCTNNGGSFACACNAGFHGNGRQLCSNIDECSENHHSCPVGKSQCVDTFGSFTCRCFEGFNDTDKRFPGTVCVSQKTFEVGQTPLSGITFEKTWKAVLFTSQFNIKYGAPVVVATVHLDGDRTLEIVPVVRRVTTKGFEVSIQFRKEDKPKHANEFENWLKKNRLTVSWMAASKGQHRTPAGTLFTAGFVQSTGQMNLATGCKNATPSWNNISWAPGCKSTPALFTQIQSLPYVETGWGSGAERVPLRAAKYCYAVARLNVSNASTANNTAQVGRVCPESAPTLNATMGWIVLAGESFKSMTLRSGRTVNYTRVVNDANMLAGSKRGNDSFVDYGATFTSAPIVIAQKVVQDDFVATFTSFEGALSSRASFRTVEPKDAACPHTAGPARREYMTMFVSNQAFSV